MEYTTCAGTVHGEIKTIPVTTRCNLEGGEPQDFRPLD